MWMEVHVCSIKPNSQAGHIWVKDIVTAQKGHQKKSVSGLKILGILPENSAEGLMSRTEPCWAYISIYENTLEKLPQT